MKIVLEIAFLAAALSSTASAATYKCKDAAGRLSYQQQPCPEHAAQTKITSEADDWKMVRAREPIPTSPVGATLDTYLDVAHIKSDGQRRIASFKRIMRVDGERDSKPSISYVAYDCARGTITVRGRERDLEDARMYLYDVYRRQNSTQEVFTDPAVIQHICKG